jgi:hypothetical protein
MISRESVLDTLLYPGAIGRERDRGAVMAHQCVDIGLRGGDPLRLAG